MAHQKSVVSNFNLIFKLNINIKFSGKVEPFGSSWVWLVNVPSDVEPSSLHIQTVSLSPAAIKTDSGPWGAGENFLYWHVSAMTFE